MPKIYKNKIKILEPEFFRRKESDPEYQKIYLKELEKKRKSDILKSVKASFKKKGVVARTENSLKRLFR